MHDCWLKVGIQKKIHQPSQQSWNWMSFTTIVICFKIEFKLFWLKNNTWFVLQVMFFVFVRLKTLPWLASLLMMLRLSFRWKSSVRIFEQIFTPSIFLYIRSYFSISYNILIVFDIPSAWRRSVVSWTRRWPRGRSSWSWLTWNQVSRWLHLNLIWRSEINW